MSGAAKTNFQVTNLTQVVNPATTGIHFVQGRSLRGKFNTPDKIFNSWPQFVSDHGGLSNELEAPKYIKRLLEKGSSIRFNRVGHYTDITDPDTLDAVKATAKDNVFIEIGSEFQVDNIITLTVGVTPLDPITVVTHTQAMNDIITALEAEAPIKDVVVLKSSTIEDPRTIFQIIPTGATLGGFNINISGTPGPTAQLMSCGGTGVDFYGIENILFQLEPKLDGLDGNDFIVYITNGLNGQPGYFNINITHKTQTDINESFNNLKIIGTPTAAASDYLDKIEAESNYFKPVYQDLSLFDHEPAPIPCVLEFIGGSDGSAPTQADFVGDSAAGNGLYAFDNYDDSMELTIFDHEAFHINVSVAATSYCANRKDLINYINLDGKNKDAILVQRQALGDSKYQYIVGGGLKLLNPTSNGQYEANVMADVLSAVARTDRDFGPWYSFAGPNRGIVTGALGVIVNYGAPAKSKDLDELANRQVNMMVNKAGSIKLWGSFTGQFSNDQEKFINVERLIIYLQKSLRPILDTFLEEPNDIPTWRRIYYTVKPFLDNLATKRAYYYYDWQGDQFVNSIDNLQINNATDVGQGKYKVNLLIKPIPPLQEINVNIILAPTGVSFEIANQLI